MSCGRNHCFPTLLTSRALMSRMLVENPSVVPMSDPASIEPVQAGRSNMVGPKSPWKWAAITCVILSISAGIRLGRDLQFRGRAEQSRKCPFPLSELPKTLGTWTAVPNSDSRLDPEIARLAGSSDHVIRAYADSTTGEVATVLVLYGLADSVFGHTPEICYNAAGYRFVSAPTDRQFVLSDSSTPVEYRGFYVAKQGVASTEYSEVVWSFWHAGSWWPDVSTRWKLFRYSPGMFKIQIERPASGLSLESFSNEPLLVEIVKEINSRIEKSKVTAGGNSTQVVTSQ
jgi:Protein of unknown function (DUF3485)